MRTYRDRSFLAMCLALVIALAGCAPAAQPNTTPELVSLKVVVQPFMSFAPYFIAQEEGYFTEQGLDVELVNIITTADIIPAMLAGEADVAAGLLGAGIINTIARGGEIVIVADKGYIDPNGCDNTAIVARGDLADASNPDVLRGKLVTSVNGTWIEYFLAKELETIGFTVADIERVALNSPEQLEALNQSALDYATNNEPWILRFEAAGHQRVLTPVTQLLPNSQTAVMYYGPKLLGDNAAVGEQFMLAYLKAVRQYNEGATARNVEILAGPNNLDADTLGAMCWPALHPDGAVNVNSMLDFQSWAVSAGYVETPLPIEDFWDPHFVDFAVGELGR